LDFILVWALLLFLLYLPNFKTGFSRFGFTQDIEAATIPVEKITCPILLISGEDDKMWPSTMFSNLVMECPDKKKSTIIRNEEISC